MIDVNVILYNKEEEKEYRILWISKETSYEKSTLN